VRRNMEMFQRAFAMFTPFAKREAQGNDTTPRPTGSGGGTDEIDDLKRQMEEMRKQLERLGNKDNG
jgi:polyhydroxyalkanoate synthesis regulator protein